MTVSYIRNKSSKLQGDTGQHISHVDTWIVLIHVNDLFVQENLYIHRTRCGRNLEYKVSSHPLYPQGKEH